MNNQNLNDYINDQITFYSQPFYQRIYTLEYFKELKNDNRYIYFNYGLLKAYCNTIFFNVGLTFPEEFIPIIKKLALLEFYKLTRHREIKDTMLICNSVSNTGKNIFQDIIIEHYNVLIWTEYTQLKTYKNYYYDVIIADEFSWLRLPQGITHRTFKIFIQGTEMTIYEYTLKDKKTGDIIKTIQVIKSDNPLFFAFTNDNKQTLLSEKKRYNPGMEDETAYDSRTEFVDIGLEFPDMKHSYIDHNGVRTPYKYIYYDEDTGKSYKVRYLFHHLAIYLKRFYKIVKGENSRLVNQKDMIEKQTRLKIKK